MFVHSFFSTVAFYQTCHNRSYLQTAETCTFTNGKHHSHFSFRTFRPLKSATPEKTNFHLFQQEKKSLTLQEFSIVSQEVEAKTANSPPLASTAITRLSDPKLPNFPTLPVLLFYAMVMAQGYTQLRYESELECGVREAHSPMLSLARRDSSSKIAGEENSRTTRRFALLAGTQTAAVGQSISHGDCSPPRLLCFAQVLILAPILFHITGIHRGVHRHNPKSKRVNIGGGLPTMAKSGRISID